jgi:hypothetical protein
MAFQAYLGTIGEVEDVAGVVSYLAGPDGKWVTGMFVYFFS